MSISLTWEFYKAVKEISYCVICKEKEHQFHHVCPAEKISEIGKIARFGNISLLRHEFSKVIPLCDACHKSVHRGKKNGWMDGVADNGVKSSDYIARRWMPWLEVIGEPIL